jgi:membrane protease subunit (stomatin/prohibitin family)
MVKPITKMNNNRNNKKKKTKSFWFEYAEEKGVNPHKSAWEEFSAKEKEKKRATENATIRFCTQCGGTLNSDSRFCQRCGHRVKKRTK